MNPKWVGIVETIRGHVGNMAPNATHHFNRQPHHQLLHYVIFTHLNLIGGKTTLS